MGEIMLNPIAALTRKTLGGTAEQADGLLAAMVYALATEQKESSRGSEGSTQRDVSRAVRCVSPAAREGVG